MGVKDVGAGSGSMAFAAMRQQTVKALTGKETGSEDSVAVSLSPQAMAHAQTSSPPLTKEEAEANARRMLALRNEAMARTPAGPDLASAFFSDPTTAVDAVRFQAFFQHATVEADEMADALHSALMSPGQGGDVATNARDLALTQARLNLVVEKYVSSDYQSEAGAFVSQFIDDKASQADQVNKVALTQAAKLAQSLGDNEQARHHLDAIAQLNAGTHASQRIRNEMLTLTAGSHDSEVWFSSINQWVNDNHGLSWSVEVEKSHLSALQAQWQTFVGRFNKPA